MHAHTVKASTLVNLMLELNHCWPDWPEMRFAEIRKDSRLIEGPHPQPWRDAAQDVKSLIARRGELVGLNPQPLPPKERQLREVAVAVEIADRLIGSALQAAHLDTWLGHEHGANIVKRLQFEVDDLCPAPVILVIRHRPVPTPGPVPDPWRISLSALGQLAMGARLAGAAEHATSDSLRRGFIEAGQKLTGVGFANLDRQPEH